MVLVVHLDEVEAPIPGVVLDQFVASGLRVAATKGAVDQPRPFLRQFPASPCVVTNGRPGRPG